ncbi:MAG: DNA recombination protein RmuC [Chthoniobacteraceae bacterium]
MNDAAFLGIGLALGGLCAWLIQHFRFQARRGCAPGELDALKQNAAALQARLEEVLAARDRLEATAREQGGELGRLQAELAAEQTRRAGLAEQLTGERAQLETLNQRMKTEFQNLANEVLQTVSRRFTEANQENLGGILQPLKENIEAFRKRIEEGTASDADARGRLFQELDHLRLLNNQLTQEAANLARALRGNNKTAGNWGEMILDTVLAHSGLTEGVEYERQAANRNEDGQRIQPDTIIYYPRQQGVLIVDSKVSLKDYTDYCNAEETPDRQRSAKAHLDSLRAHICGLSGKKYETGQGWLTPEFVLLFLPVDGALSLALNQDAGLYQYAFERNIILITPSTLLTTLKLVRSLWQQDRQNRNAEEVAERGGRLYDKFVTFYQTLETVEEGFQKTSRAFSEAKGQLGAGKGNLIRQVEQLRELGVKASKALPETASPE